MTYEDNAMQCLSINTAWAMIIIATGTLAAGSATAADEWVVYDGFDGPGKGKHVVLVSGDEEYRSEEALPQLGKILAKHHGFKCTVLFAINSKTGEIDPINRHNIPGLESLKTADLMIIATRFRDLPDDQMQHIDNYLKTGKPVIGMRTATHAFNVAKGKAFSHYGNGYKGEKKEWSDGFGRLVLGEKWISHHGSHKNESTRGLIAKGAEKSIVRGIADGDIWAPTDVYGVRLPLPGDSKPVVFGQVLVRKGKRDNADPFFGMRPDDEPLVGKKNEPMMPVAWTKTYQTPGGKTGKVFATTMGSSTDLVSEGLRRLLVNAAYWCVGMEKQIPEKTNVSLVGKYKPRAYGFGSFAKGMKPSDFAME
jgi:type 1 glutamine amidotransferase